jgi:hypothetical protein
MSACKLQTRSGKASPDSAMVVAEPLSVHRIAIFNHLRGKIKGETAT